MATTVSATAVPEQFKAPAATTLKVQAPGGLPSTLRIVINRPPASTKTSNIPNQG
jgi:hypothetical protein